MSWIGDAVSGVLSVIADPIKEWQERKTIKATAKLEIEKIKAQAEVEKAKQVVNAETNWDLEALRQTQHSWKDEYLLIVLTTPFVLSFVPTVQDFIITGWQYVSKAPEWYQIALLGAIAASFGIRWMIGKYKLK